MPVIINEFEIVPGPTSAAKPETKPTPPPLPLRPDDIERIETRHRRRMQRLCAD
jgi:hypothetical protein